MTEFYPQDVPREEQKDIIEQVYKNGEGSRFKRSRSVRGVKIKIKKVNVNTIDKKPWDVNRKGFTVFSKKKIRVGNKDHKRQRH